MATTIEALNGVAEFVEMAEFMGDDEFTDALATIVKIMSTPDIPSVRLPSLIAKLQAYSAKFALLAAYHVNLKKNEREKKNIYFSAEKAISELVSALKYSMRNG